MNILKIRLDINLKYVSRRKQLKKTKRKQLKKKKKRESNDQTGIYFIII